MSRFIVFVSITAAVFALAACADDSEDSAAEPPAWNHDPADAIGPSGWGSLDDSYERCMTGREQSPVDIVVADVRGGFVPSLEFQYEAEPLIVENTGHVIEVPMPEESDNRLVIGEDEYRLLQYHVHVPSEHTLDGESQDGEVHLVHESAEGKLAVVGVLLGGSNAPSALVDTVLTQAPEEAGEDVELGAVRNPLELVPGNEPVVTGYLTYSGSLTTPGCTEGVRWIILDDALGVSRAALDRVSAIIGSFPNYDGYDSNNRPVQPLNDRIIGVDLTRD